MRERIHLIGGGFEIHSNPGRGTRITGSELFLAKRDGTASRKLVSVPGVPFYPAWSPSGTKLRFSLHDYRNNRNSLWEVSAQGTNLHPMFPGWNDSADECCGGKWTTDGKYFVFEAQGQIWALSEKGASLRPSADKPIQLTSSPLGLFTPLPSKDGKKLFVVGRHYRGELERVEAKSGQSRPIFPVSPPRTSRFPKTASGWSTSPSPKVSFGAANGMAATSTAQLASAGGRATAVVA